MQLLGSCYDGQASGGVLVWSVVWPQKQNQKSHASLRSVGWSSISRCWVCETTTLLNHHQNIQLYLNETKGFTISFIIVYFHLGVSMPAVLISTNKDQQHCSVLCSVSIIWLGSISCVFWLDCNIYLKQKGLRKWEDSATRHMVVLASLSTRVENGFVCCSLINFVMRWTVVFTTVHSGSASEINGKQCFITHGVTNPQYDAADK